MPLNISKLKERFENKSAGRADRLQLKDGENYLRFLPPTLEALVEDVDYICLMYLMHFKLGVDGDKKAEVCPKTAGKSQRCPVCEAVHKLYKTNKPEDKALANDLRAKTRYIFNCIDLKEKEKGIQVLEIGPKIYEDIVRYLINPKWGDLLDLDRGRNVTITKVPKEETTTGYVDYHFEPDPDVTPMREMLQTTMPKWKESIDALKKQVPAFKTYEELVVVLEGGTSAEPVPVKEVVDDVKFEQVDPNDFRKVSEPPSVVPEKAPAVKVAVEVPLPEGEKPKCFSKDYGPRKEVCVKCPVKAPCKEAFLTM